MTDRPRAQQAPLPTREIQPDELLLVQQFRALSLTMRDAGM